MDLIPFSGFTEIRTEHLNKRWKAPRGLEAEVDAAWEERVRQAEERGIVLFNGEAIRARAIFQDRNVLFVETQETDYKHHVATRENPDLRFRDNLLYAAAIVRVLDDGNWYQVFGVNEGGSEAAGIGNLNVVAGVVEPRDFVEVSGKKVISIEAALYREMDEEIGLQREDYSVRPSFVVREEHWQHPSIVYIAETGIGLDAVRQRYDAAVQRDLAGGKKPEHGQIVFIKDTADSLNSEFGRFESRVRILEEFYLKRS